MKKNILTILFVFLVCTALHAQISGAIKWKQGVDFTIHTRDEYTEIFSRINVYERSWKS